MCLEQSLLRQWAQLSPSSIALKTPDQNFTWLQLVEHVDQVAIGLHHQDVKAGQVLTCVGKNSPELLFIYLACLELGAICALTMPQSNAEFEVKLTTLYQNSRCANIWLSEQYEGLVQRQNTQLSRIEGETFESSYSVNSLASIVFTSGSTGRPKAVAHTSSQHLASASGLLERLKFTQRDCWLLSLPMYHVSGLAIVYRWLSSGATLKIGTGIFESDIQEVTHASLVATQLKRLLASRVKTRLTHVLLGGSHIPLELSQQAASQGIETWLGYGMTEAASTVTAKPIDHRYNAGEVLPKRKLKIVDSRIYIGGETLASGYYQQGDLQPITENGWFDSRDLGMWVGEELKVIGRADNQFISGGENIHCEEIESVLNQLPQIKQSLVIPVENEEFGHRPVAVIELNTALTKSRIEQHLRERLVKFKWPIAYYIMPSELSTGGVKVSRAKVKQWLLTQANSALS